MKLITLTLANEGEAVYVNPEAVFNVTTQTFSDGRCTVITSVGHEQIHVREKAEAVARLMEEMTCEVNVSVGSYNPIMVRVMEP